MKTVYKVLRVDDITGKLVPARASSPVIEYIVGKRIAAADGTRLFVFPCIGDAHAFAKIVSSFNDNANLVLYRCLAEDCRTQPYCSRLPRQNVAGAYIAFWESDISRLTEATYMSYPPDGALHSPPGTMSCLAVTLVEELEWT